MNLNCEQAEEYLAPFVLDALTPGERLEVLEHLADCRHHDEELARLRVTAGQLPLALHSRQPPPALRSNLMAAFDTALLASGAITEQATAQWHQRASERVPFWRRLSPAYGLAAVLLLAVIALAAWNLSLGAKTSGDVRTATAVSGSMRLRVTYVPARHLAVLTVDLPAPPAGHTYQGWRLEGDKAQSLGPLAASSGTNTFTANLGDASAVAISVEPEGGSPQPTTPPLLVAHF